MYLICRVSEVDSKFFEKFGTLVQKYKEKELLIAAAKSPSQDIDHEQVFLEAHQNFGATMPGMTWDNLAYTTSFTFNQGMQKKDVSF